jgi:hypothetical protein
MEMKEKLYKEKVSENKTIEIHYLLIFCSTLLYSLFSQQWGMAMAFIEES